MIKLYAAAALLPQGLERDVVVELNNGIISAVRPNQEPGDATERYELLVPAVSNLHSHAFQRAMAGLAERRTGGDDSFWSWRTIMYKLALSMSPDDVEAVASQLYVEMLEAGFARVGEFHYLHHDQSGEPYSNIAEMAERIGAASVESGIGLTLLPVFYAHGGFGPQAPGADQRRFINDTDRFGALMWASRRVTDQIDGAHIGIAPHSLRAATVAEIDAILPLAQGGPVHIHVAEQVLEVQKCLEAHGLRPVQLLMDRLPVDENWCLIHATHLDDAEVAAVVHSGAVAGLCPITEANLGDGIFRGGPFLAAGGRYGVGSDSNVKISLRGELRQLEYSQRLEGRIRNVVAAPNASTGETLLQLAAQGGAKALGWRSGIAAGMPADLLSLDVKHAPYLPHGSQLDAWIFAEGVAVQDVWSMGCKQVENGRHKRAESVRRRFSDTMARLLAA